MNPVEMARSTLDEGEDEFAGTTKRILTPMLGSRLYSVDHVRCDGQPVIRLGFSSEDAPGWVDVVPIHHVDADRTLRVGNPVRVEGAKGQVVEVRWGWGDSGDTVVAVRDTREWIPLDRIPESRLRELLHKLHRRIPGLRIRR